MPISLRSFLFGEVVGNILDGLECHARGIAKVPRQREVLNMKRRFYLGRFASGFVVATMVWFGVFCVVLTLMYD